MPRVTPVGEKGRTGPCRRHGRGSGPGAHNPCPGGRRRGIGHL